ncbi:hypothetical protein BDN72DRAFT_964121 [Pluteus cervinus]|uniref:Uncharacterized protein n=1 Tax=Pluteus cervinus TaxID=181527 RepID=A0ACD3ABQ9_9AGAR|nr:hypothetical protein BDN72DRAFT_964121 [Pluteus cervinus]
MVHTWLLQPKVRNPVLILTCQSFLLVFGWVFYTVTRNRPVALPNGLAIAYDMFPQTFTFVITLVASTLSIASAYFYSLAIRHMLTMSLSNPISLFAVSSSIQMAGKRPLWNLTRPWWTIASFICIIAVGAQTASWATLLTPHPIQITADVAGFGLDISNPDFIKLADDQFNSGMLKTDRLTNVMPLVEASGMAAISNSLNLPSILNYNDVSFITNTGGILPANLFSISSGVTAGQDLPINTFVDDSSIENTPVIFSRNYTVTQQGFTAPISCEQRNLTATTVPSLLFENSTGTMMGNETVAWKMYLGCPLDYTESSPDVYGIQGNVNGVFYARCLPEENGTDNATIVLWGIGIYAWIPVTLCTLTPQITTVNVTYIAQTSASGAWPSFIEVGEPLEARNVPQAGGIPLAMLQNIFFYAQTLYAHSVGNALSRFYSGVSATSDVDFTNRLLEAYLKGAFEFSGTILRASYTENDNELFPGNQSVIPLPMRTPVNGTFISTTVGWKQKDAVPVSLIAPTFVLAMSIGVVIFTLMRNYNTKIVDDQDHFDAGNILHVISASAAGGLPRNFPRFSAEPGDALRYEQSVEVRLGLLPETGTVGLLHSSTVESLLGYPPMTAEYRKA